MEVWNRIWKKILVWNGIWKKILVWNGIWNGRFLVWNGNGMEENCHYGIWKNRLPFHTMPWVHRWRNRGALAPPLFFQGGPWGGPNLRDFFLK